MTKETKAKKDSGQVSKHRSFEDKQYYFIGIGGIGMSGLAKILLKNGAKISGSDMEGGFVTNRLSKLGADIKIGHFQEWLERLGDDVDTVVISAAINESNPELAYARSKGFRVLKYAQMLGSLMDEYRGIAIAGTHGKSTTTGWLAFVLDSLKTFPNYIVGADIPQLEGSSGVGDSDYFLAEACEYDRSFLNIHPQIAVILNIEQDHLDYYKDESDIVDAFVSFAHGTRNGGSVIVNSDDKNFPEFLAKYASQASDKTLSHISLVTFGLGKQADFSADCIRLVDGLYEFNVCFKGYTVGRVKLSMPGKHNIYNALAVVAAAASSGVDMAGILSVMGDYTGADRRMMVKAQMAGIKILDDYAHHPTEIRASLEAITQRYGPKRLVCIFQPHQYSRTRFLLDDFAESFKLADITIVPDIYFVRDTQESRHEVNSEILVDRIRQSGSEAVFIDSFSGICEYLKDNIDSGDVIVTMGAGDIWKVSDEYIQWLRRDS